MNVYPPISARLIFSVVPRARAEGSWTPTRREGSVDDETPNADDFDLEVPQ